MTVRCIQARDVLDAFGVVALHALEVQRTETVGWARIEGGRQRRLVRIRVDVRTAVGEAGGRVAALLQRAQRIFLGVVPGFLGKRFARVERPRGACARLRAAGGGARLDVALKPQVQRLDGGAFARIDGDHDGARRAAVVGRLGQINLDVRAEVAQRGEQFARIGIGRAQQARELAFLQIGKGAKALQFEVLFQVVAHFLGRAHLQRERGGA